MGFEINGNPVPKEPRSNGFRFRLPEPRPFGGEGRVIANSDKPSLEIEFDELTMAEWNWWIALTGTDLSVDLTSVKFWNPYKSGGVDWDTWTGGAILHRPTYDRIEHGMFYLVSVQITAMVES